MKRPSVAILMATYNGANYIARQLDSLMEQTYPYWRLVVHDDGSTDDTLAIVNGYSARDPRIILLDDRVSKQGASKNYLHLLNEVDSDLYLFCDQDDIWLANKIECMVNKIAGSQQPTLVYGNAYFYREGRVIDQKTTTIHPHTLRDSLFFNSGIQGCSMIINAQLLALLKPFPDVVAMHDHLLTMGAVAFGRIVYVDEVLMWYRQHALNVTGNQKLGYLTKIRAFFKSGKPVIDSAHFVANQAFYSRYFPLLTGENRELFQAYFRYAHSRSVVKRITILIKNRFTLGDKKGVLILKTMLRKPIG